MDFFVKFRRWKAYQLLHTMTRGRAVGRVRKALSVSAFIVDPNLQLGLLDLGVICERMRGAVSHHRRHVLLRVGDSERGRVRVQYKS